MQVGPPSLSAFLKQERCLELPLHTNAINMLGERTVHVGEGF